MARLRYLTERSGEDAASLAGRALNGETLTPDQVKTLAASVLSQRRELRLVPRSKVQALAIVLPPRESRATVPPELRVEISGSKFAIPLEAGDLDDLAIQILSDD